MNVDKNKAVIEYLLTCPQIQGSPLYFNFANIKDKSTQFLTMTDDITYGRSYVDGSVPRRYVFDLAVFYSMTDNPVVTIEGYANENMEDIETVQKLIDWISEQSANHNYPDFGETNIVEDIRTTTATPRLEGINTEVSPPLAMYSVSIQIDYIDKSKVLWNTN